MRLTVQKRLASQVLNCSPKKVWIDPERLEEIREAITKRDIQDMVNTGLIKKKKTPLHSRARARLNKLQKSKGRRRGMGRRKGGSNARTPTKEHWITHVRAQRDLARTLFEKNVIERAIFLELMRKIKGGFFRNRRHIKLYLAERRLISEVEVKEPAAEAKKESTVKKVVKSKPKEEAKK
ncbi:50S ribosomal protein L19e [Candidatus Woesearchaeota archaeon]|nr:50S ribosomal protein L19e [Candidatus Woesearchaeota archaeon]